MASGTGSGAAAVFRRETGARYPILLDPDGSVAQQFGVVRTPWFALIDRGGRVLYRGALVPP